MKKKRDCVHGTDINALFILARYHFGSNAECNGIESYENEVAKNLRKREGEKCQLETKHH